MAIIQINKFVKLLNIKKYSQQPITQHIPLFIVIEV